MLIRTMSMVRPMLEIATIMVTFGKMTLTIVIDLDRDTRKMTGAHYPDTRLEIFTQ